MAINSNYPTDNSGRNPNTPSAPRHPVLLKLLGCAVYAAFATSLSLSIGVFWLAAQPGGDSLVIKRGEPGAVTEPVKETFTEAPKTTHDESAPLMPPARISGRNKEKIFDSPDYKCLDGIECFEAGANLMGRAKYREAAVQLKLGCEMNNPQSCWKMGELEFRRWIPDASREKADYYFRQSCFQGLFGAGCIGLVDNLRKNFAPSSERDMAITQALDIACRQGIQKACNDRAVTVTPDGTKPKKPEAITDTQAEELAQACQEGDSKACLKVAEHYENHPDLSPKERTDKARQIYEFLCQKRDPQGCQNLRKIKRAAGI
ncbi:hypothetical protein [Succinimonas sp.]|uniref:hypothetical protein n=1 Tax=Succinimonas sp. TaxID=1936151 RepID=UPI0038651E99